MSMPLTLVRCTDMQPRRERSPLAPCPTMIRTMLRPSALEEISRFTLTPRAIGWVHRKSGISLTLWLPTTSTPRFSARTSRRTQTRFLTSPGHRRQRHTSRQ